MKELVKSETIVSPKRAARGNRLRADTPQKSKPLTNHRWRSE
jgi:hypothetical protein